MWWQRIVVKSRLIIATATILVVEFLCVIYA